AAVYFRWPVDFRLTYIALLAACPVLLFSEKRLEIIKTVDWHTLIFFAAMFVLMASVWDSGFFQSLVARSGLPVSAVPVVLGAGVLLSQLISNVPMVALYMPLLLHDGVSIKALVALAAGSTIAGNLLILGAASNVIILHNAEKKAGVTLTFTEFLKVGLPLTLINVAVYWLFLTAV
ncbi:MAG: anion transporter, partial [Gammaproteobacteria bacterium]|nr:anion transporter [Gammaproteobacteria bacterium]